mmetsp:Transcript_12160/g.15825  ORF Transcript_12160/g.15825 Transcript_12160/m.15825 type:complete len:421 (+) Transcript_12160:1-1263(+)
MDNGPSSSLVDYVSKCKRNLQTLLKMSKIERKDVEASGIWVVCGNEAHDLDSQVCALVTSRLLSSQQQQKGSGSDSSGLVLPVMNVSRQEADLRKDNILALKIAGISNEDLIYMDEVPMEEWIKAGCLNIALCDHNELSPRQAKFETFVKIIIDHHRDTGYYPQADRTIRFPTGSCASLVAEAVFKSSPELLKDNAIALLLRCAILIDTQNFTDEHKTTEFDVEMFGLLPPLAALKLHGKVEMDVDLDDKKLHNALKSAQKDTDGLSTVDIIRKDLKYAADTNRNYLFAVSSVKSTVEELGLYEQNKKGKFLLQLIELMDAEKENPLDGYFVLCFSNKSFKHLIAAFRKGRHNELNAEDLETELIKGDKSYGGLKISGKRDAWPGLGQDKGFEFALYQLGQPISRKQVLPFITDWFSSKT